MANARNTSTSNFVVCIMSTIWLLGIVSIVAWRNRAVDILAQQTETARITTYRSNIRDARFAMKQAIAVASLYELNRSVQYHTEFKTQYQLTKDFLKRIRADVADSEAVELLNKLDALRSRILEQKLNPLIDDISIKSAARLELQKLDQEIQPLVAEFDADILAMKNHLPPPAPRDASWDNDTLIAGLEIAALTVICLLSGLSISKRVSQPSNQLTHVPAVARSDGPIVNSTNTGAEDLIEHAVDVICLIDAQFCFVSVNPASKSAWGYLPEELLSRPVSDFILSADLDATMRAVVGVERSIDKVSFENRFRRKDGKTIHLLWSVHWSASSRGLFCVVHDISERKENEQLKRDLMAMISHDLRTPLSSIKALLELIEELNGQLTEKTLRLVSSGRNETERLIRLINDLLDIEKMQAGKFSLQVEQTSTASILSSSAESVGRLAELRGIKIDLPPEDIGFEADRARIMQVVINLLSNAIKFSPANATINVGATCEGDLLRISVRDVGKGIAADERERIFEKFEQAEKTADAQYNGTGLGLAICKAIVEQHAGTIAVESEPGEGSTFWFEIPVKQTCTRAG